jgi:hypothetical protein
MLSRNSFLLGLGIAAAVTAVPFRIDCRDIETGRGVPLVQLETSGYISYYSDSGGVVAFDEPGLLGLPVFFRVVSDGYINSFNIPGSPQAGVLLTTKPGGQATVYLNRTQPAERLYRLTGGGLYRDTLLVGGTAPIKEPLLSSAGVLGQDSLMAVVYSNKSFWFFGDTECPAGPRNTDCQNYGKFTTGATAVASGQSGPPSLQYFTSNDARAPGGMGKNGRPNESDIAMWNPTSFTHPKAMLPGPGVIPNYGDNSWVGSATVVQQTAVEHDAGAGEVSAATGSVKQVVPAQEERMYLTYVCPNTQLQVSQRLCVVDGSECSQRLCL